MELDTKLAELISSKILHDFAGPISAINNSLDFINDNNVEIQTKAINLIKDSSKSFINKLNYYRIVFSYNKDKADINLASLEKIIKGYIANNKINVNFQIITKGAEIELDNFNISADIAKLLLGMLIITSNSILHGGNINIILNPSDNQEKIDFKIQASSEKPIKINEMLKTLFIENNEKNLEYSSYDVIYIYVYKLLLKLKCHYNIEIQDDRINFHIFS